MPLPTLVIAGAQKCGTSTLARLLRRHPQVFMSRPKELHFFDRKFGRGLEWYAEQFNPARRHRQYGEGTPTYLYDEKARQRLTHTLPEARLIVILRNPASRAYSHFWHSTRLGYEDLGFEEALAAERHRLTNGSQRDRIRFSYADRGHYVDQLTALSAQHPRELLHVMLLEDLISDRVASLRELFAFLRVDEAPADTTEETLANPYREADDDKGKPVAMNYPPMSPGTKARLVETFRESNDRLSAWLGRDLSAWSAV